MGLYLAFQTAVRDCPERPLPVFLKGLFIPESPKIVS
jgi:hypothetical protein